MLLIGFRGGSKAIDIIDTTNVARTPNSSIGATADEAKIYRRQ
jgi:hypothetical protein